MPTAEITPEKQLPEGFDTAEGFGKVRLMAALKMFELGEISSGRAAQLAGVSRLEFFEICSRYRVSVVNIPDDEVEKELRREMELGRSLFKK